MNIKHICSSSALLFLLVACGEDKKITSEGRRSAEAGHAFQADRLYSAAGEVTAIGGDQVTIAHGPIEGLGWPAMTMTFRAGSSRMVQGVRVGDRVSVEFRQDGGAYLLSSLSKGG